MAKVRLTRRKRSRKPNPKREEFAKAQGKGNEGKLIPVSTCDRYQQTLRATNHKVKRNKRHRAPFGSKPCFGKQNDGAWGYKRRLFHWEGRGKNRHKVYKGHTLLRHRKPQFISAVRKK